MEPFGAIFGTKCTLYLEARQKARSGVKGLNKVELDLPFKKVLFPYEKTTMRTHFKYVERDPKGNWPGKMTEIANGFVSSRKFLTCDQAFFFFVFFFCFVLFCFFCFFCFFFSEKGKTKRKEGPVDRRLANFPSLFQILVHV